MVPVQIVVVYNQLPGDSSSSSTMVNSQPRGNNNHVTSRDTSGPGSVLKRDDPWMPSPSNVQDLLNKIAFGTGSSTRSEIEVTRSPPVYWDMDSKQHPGKGLQVIPEAHQKSPRSPLSLPVNQNLIHAHQPTSPSITGRILSFPMHGGYYPPEQAPLDLTPDSPAAASSFSSGGSRTHSPAPSSCQSQASYQPESRDTAMSHSRNLEQTQLHHHHPNSSLARHLQGVPHPLVLPSRLNPPRPRPRAHAQGRPLPRPIAPGRITTTAPDSTVSDATATPVKKKSNRGRKPGQLSKGNHLWEFLLELLRDARYNPTHIKWENRPQGVFRITNSAEVAQMWGARKNRPKMNYEKLSRALRFCKTVGYIKDAPKDGPYPKKLCFAFGDKTTGWQQPVSMPYNHGFLGTHIKVEEDMVVGA